jgi:hypothetical protein
MTMNQDFAVFLSELDHAVQNLYDPAALRKSSLSATLGLDAQENPAILRQTLLDAIETLKPRNVIGPESKAWRTYRVLLHRYVEQFPRADVARTLGLSIRQLTREDSRSVRVLADYLWSQYVDTARGVARQPAHVHKETNAGGNGPSREQELEWLRSSMPNEAIDVRETIETVLKTVAPTAGAHCESGIRHSPCPGRCRPELLVAPGPAGRGDGVYPRCSPWHPDHWG